MKGFNTNNTFITIKINFVFEMDIPIETRILHKTRATTGDRVRPAGYQINRDDLDRPAIEIKLNHVNSNISKNNIMLYKYLNCIHRASRSQSFGASRTVRGCVQCVFSGFITRLFFFFFFLETDHECR